MPFSSDLSSLGGCPFSITGTGFNRSVEGLETFSLGRCFDDGPLIKEVVVERVGPSLDPAIVEGLEFNSAGVSAWNWEDWLQVQTMRASIGFRGMDMGGISTEMPM